jgi:hypothetical protein
MVMIDQWPNQSAEPTRSAPVVLRLSVRVHPANVYAWLSFYFRPLSMRSLISIFVPGALLATGCGHSGLPIATGTNHVQQIEVVKDVSTNNGVVLTRTAIATGSDPASDYDSVRDGEKAQATFSGGSGLSIKDAVVITATNEVAGYHAAYIWLYQHYPGSHLQDEGSDYDDTGRFWNEEKIVTADGKSLTQFFEVTSFCGQ